jgi:L-ascorbate metabolism protein UlaG (beta-lactamase superfamily)
LPNYHEDFMPLTIAPSPIPSFAILAALSIALCMGALRMAIRFSARKMTALLFLAAVTMASPVIAQQNADSPARPSECLAIAQNIGGLHYAAFQPAALQQNEAQLTFLGHSTFLIESPGGIRIATDYTGYAGGIVPDAITMNHAHSSHYTDFPDPAIKHVLKGWGENGKPAVHDVTIGDVRIRNVTTDIRFGNTSRLANENSIFVFEMAGLCIGHLGHLHHELTPEHMGWLGRLDVVLVPVDGRYTMPVENMMTVLKDIKARVIIPMHYFGATTLAGFLVESRKHFKVETRTETSLIVSPDNLPPEPTVFVLPGG